MNVSQAAHGLADKSIRTNRRRVNFDLGGSMVAVLLVVSILGELYLFGVIVNGLVAR